MPNERFRQRFNFWLDLNKADDAILAHEIEDLKKRRQFAKTIKEGIHLIVDLRRGNTDVLCELFPLFEERLRQGHSGEVIAMLDEVKTLLGNNGNGTGNIAKSFAILPVVNDVFSQKPIVNHDPEVAKQRAIQNTLASLDDF